MNLTPMFHWGWASTVNLDILSKIYLLHIMEELFRKEVSYSWKEKLSLTKIVPMGHGMHFCIKVCMIIQCKSADTRLIRVFITNLCKIGLFLHFHEFLVLFFPCMNIEKVYIRKRGGPSRVVGFWPS